MVAPDEFRPQVVYGLYFAEEVLGQADLRWRRMAGVSFGAAGISDVHPDQLPMIKGRLDLYDWAYADLHFPFDLEDLPPHQQYQEATIRAQFDPVDVTALYLEPAAESDHSAGTSTAFGYGQAQLRWKLKPSDGAYLLPRGRGVRAIVRRPLSLDEVDVVLDAQVVCTRRIVGKIDYRTAWTRDPIRYRMSFIDGSFKQIAAH